MNYSGEIFHEKPFKKMMLFFDTSKEAAPGHESKVQIVHVQQGRTTGTGNPASVCCTKLVRKTGTGQHFPVSTRFALAKPKEYAGKLLSMLQAR